jgi:diacylglycerol kinase (ATP)
MNDVRTKLIVNPVSGRDGALDVLVDVNAALRATGPVDIVLTVEPGDAERAAQRALEEGYARVVAVGGDGTLNEVLNGVAAGQDRSRNSGLDAVVIGVIPLGTGNDFANTLGMPEDPAAAAAALATGVTRDVDVWRVNNRCFVNVSGGGFLADVSDAVDTRLKTLAGKLAYLIGGVQTIWRYDPLRARVRFPQGAISVVNADAVPLDAAVDEIYAFAACNAPLVGGGHVIGPLAQPDDGQLDVCVIRAASVADFVDVLRQIPSGDHVYDARVVYVRTPAVEFAFDRSIKINTDGQVLEAAGATYTFAGKVRFLVPMSASAPDAATP